MNLQLIRKTIGGAALLCASLVFASQALAAAPLARIVVAKSGGNYTTITAALAAITPTATKPYVIEVWPGVYTEPNTVNMKSYVHLKGSGRDVTIVKTALGAGADVIWIGNLADATVSLTDVTVSGLTITGGRTGVYMYYSTNLTLSDNTMSNNSSGASFKGDYGATNRPVLITRNNIVNNSDWGVHVKNTRLGRVTDNYISGNGSTHPICTEEGNDCAGIYFDKVFDSVASGNVITGNGVGIEVYYDSTPTISNNVITNNNLAGVALVYLGAGGKITNNVILNNGGTTHTDIVVADGGGTPDGAGGFITFNPNISFNVFNDISGGTRFPGSTGTRGVGSYNVNSNGDPILVP